MANYEQGVSYQEQKVSEKVKKKCLSFSEDFLHAIPKIATRKLCFYPKSHLFIRPYQTDKLEQIAGDPNCNFIV